MIVPSIPSSRKDSDPVSNRPLGNARVAGLLKCSGVTVSVQGRHGSSYRRDFEFLWRCVFASGTHALRRISGGRVHEGRRWVENPKKPKRGYGFDRNPWFLFGCGGRI